MGNRERIVRAEGLLFAHVIRVFLVTLFIFDVNLNLAHHIMCGLCETVTCINMTKSLINQWSEIGRLALWCSGTVKQIHMTVEGIKRLG